MFLATNRVMFILRLRFNVKTGEPLELPATEAIKTYAVKIENNEILIAL